MHTAFYTFKNNPIFITGYPRSGTTLMKSLLDNHPQLVVFPEELEFGHNCIDRHLNASLCKNGLDITRFFSNVTYLKRNIFKHWTGAYDKRNYSNINYDKFEETFLHKVYSIKSKKDFFLAIIESYYAVETSDKSDKKAWVEKSPGNIRYYYVYKKWFGERLKWIYMERCPHETYASYKKTLESRDNRMNIKAVEYLKTIDGFSFSLLVTRRRARYIMKKDKNFFIVQYEDLINNPRSVMEGLCQKIGITFTESVLKPTFNGNEWSGNSSFGTQFTSISKRNDKNRNTLSRETRDKIDHTLHKYNTLKYKILMSASIALDRIRFKNPELANYLGKILRD